MQASAEPRSMHQDGFELQRALQTRLDNTVSDKEVLQGTVQALEIQIANAIRSLPRRIPHTDEELDKLIKEKEFKHETSTVSTAEERKMLKEIDKLKQSKKQVAAYNSTQDQIDGLKRRKTVLQEELRGKELAINELQKGLKKLDLLRRLNISPNELVENCVQVPEAAIPRVIGKGGGKLRELEEQFMVMLDVDGRTCSVQITGATSGVLAAQEQIAVIIDTMVEEVKLTEPQIVTLLHSRGARINQLSAQFDVRMDANIANLTVKIIGRTTAVEAAKQALLDVDAGVDKIRVNGNLMGTLIGKGGANIRKLEADFGVHVDVSKDNNSISVQGPADCVRRAGKHLRDFIDENQEEEVTLQAQRSAVLTSIIGKNGETIRALQKEMGVAIKVDRRDESEDKQTKEEPTTMIEVTIRGPVSKIHGARQRLLGLLSLCDQQTLIVPVPEHILPSVIGKKGAKIQAVREKFPDATIDVDWSLTCVRIHATAEDQRQGVRDEIDDIIDQNFAIDIPVDPDVTITLKSKSEAATRKQLADMQVTMDIDSDAGQIRIRGRRAAVYDAANLLQVFVDANRVIDLNADTDDQEALLAGGENSLIRKLQQQFSVAIRVDRVQNIIRFRGAKDQVNAAYEHVVKILAGDPESGSIFVHIEPDAMGAVIGKAGGNIKAIKKRYNVELDILRSKSWLRLRGDPVKIFEAKQHIIRFLATVRSMVTVPIPTDMNDTNIEAAMQSVGQKYNVKIERLLREFTLQGPLYELPCAKLRFEQELAGEAVHAIRIAEDHIARILPNLDALKSQKGVEIELVESEPSIVVRGRLPAVDKAKLAVHRLLDALFPFEYNHIDVPLAILHVVADKASLDSIANATGADVWKDVECSCVRIRGHDGQVGEATEHFRQRLQQHQATHAQISLDDRTLGEVVTNDRMRALRALEQQINAEVQVDAENKVIRIAAADAQSTSDAQSAVQSFLRQIQKEVADLAIPEAAVGSMLGREWAHIKKLESTFGCTIKFDKESNTLTIRGDEAAVAAAARQVEANLAQWKERNYSENMFIPSELCRTLIGAGGATIREIQSTNHVGIDVSRDHERAIIRGKKADVQRARQDITSRLGPELEAATKAKEEAERIAQAQKAAKASLDNDRQARASTFPVIPPGAPKDLVDRLTGASKPKRKRDKKGKNDGEDKADESQESSPVQEEQSSQIVEPATSLAPMQRENDADARRIYASPPPGLGMDLHRTTAPTAPAAHLNGKADELLTMLLGTNPSSTASAKSTQPHQSRPAAESEKQVEYYTSSSGFSIRL